MNVRFGNLTANQFNQKFDIELSKEDLEYIEKHRQDNAQSISKDRLHIFDTPLGIVAGSDIVEDLMERLRKYRFNHRFYVEERKES